MSSSPRTPPPEPVPHVAIAHADSDSTALDLFAAGARNLSAADRFKRRDAPLDPLLIAAAAASGPHVTRHHYHHDFFPPAPAPAEPLWDWSAWQGTAHGASKQAPRSLRLKSLHIDVGKAADSIPSAAAPVPSSGAPTPELTPSPPSSPAELAPLVVTASESAEAQPPVEARCMARTRIPTPYGHAFLHLYHNTRDAKEHLAIVVDPAQLAGTDAAGGAPPIRSHSLDAAWPGETAMDRVTRGAYVGRLSASSCRASTPPAADSAHTDAALPAPLVRIHSECFTGETLGSQRCDCGEQLSEALRRIFAPTLLRGADGTARTLPGRGAVVYLRQEGRGIGLLDKLRAYNLQDLGHDTVAANVLLGRGADERAYDVAAAILRDLGLAEAGAGVRLLTNNPDKVAALAREGVRVEARVPMVPKAWACGAQDEEGRVGGAELEKYLRTKVLKMGHMLSLPASDETADAK